MRALKNVAVTEGCIPEYSRTFLTNIMAGGSIYKIPLSRIRRREAIGLPPLPLTKTQDLTKLAEKTNTLSLLKKPK
jgi:heterodisulfide reductase subunit C